MRSPQASAVTRAIALIVCFSLPSATAYGKCTAHRYKVQELKGLRSFKEIPLNPLLALCEAKEK